MFLRILQPLGEIRQGMELFTNGDRNIRIRFFIETAKNFWDFLSKRRKGKGMEREKDEDEGVS